MRPVQTDDPPLRLLAAFFDHFPGQTPECIVQAPNRDMWGMAVLRDIGCFTIVAPDLTDEVRVTVDSARADQTALNRPLPEWARFAAGVLPVLADAGMMLPGGDIALAGEEPAGPRYAYALGIATAAVLCAMVDAPYDSERLTEIVERVRRER